MKKTLIVTTIALGVFILGVGVYCMTVPNDKYVPTAEEVREANAKVMSLELEIQEKEGLISTYQDMGDMEAKVMVLEDELEILQTELNELVEANEENIEE